MHDQLTPTSVHFREAEVMDIDEATMREDRLSAQLYGYGRIPHLKQAKCMEKRHWTPGLPCWPGYRKKAYTTPEIVKSAPHNQAIHRLKNSKIDQTEHRAMTWRAYLRKRAI